MSQDFKLNFYDSREVKQTGQETGDAQDESALYDTPGNVRNLCFVWPDGRMKFLNYAYLISANFNPIEGEIMIIFSSSKIILKGHSLVTLFKLLITFQVKLITCVDCRYQNIEGLEPQITEILLYET